MGFRLNYFNISTRLIFPDRYISKIDCAYSFFASRLARSVKQEWTITTKHILTKNALLHHYIKIIQLKHKSKDRTTNSSPYLCFFCGPLPVFFACTHAELFSGEESKTRHISLNTSSRRFSFDGADLLLVYIFPNSCQYIFSVNLSWRSCFGQTVFELHRHSFRFIDPSLQH